MNDISVISVVKTKIRECQWADGHIVNQDKNHYTVSQGNRREQNKQDVCLVINW